IFYFGLGGLPLGLIFMAYNQITYGNPLLMGYTASGHEHLLMLTGFYERLSQYLYWLAVLMCPISLLGWFGVGFCRQVHWRDRALIISWFGSILLFYSFYNIYGEWWYTRFLLPGVPAMILGGVMSVRALIERLGRGTSEQNQVRLSRWGVATM